MKNTEEIGGEEFFNMLNNAIDQLDKIEEIGTIYCQKTPTSPIHTEGDCVGIEDWAGKLIFRYSYREMFRRRNQQQPREEWDSIFFTQTMQFSRGVLLFCNDCTTAWNSRKRALSMISDPSLLTKQLIKEEVVKELEFGRWILRRNPKSGETFTHRRWLLQHFKLLPSSSSGCHGDMLMTAAERQQVFEYELNLCTKTADWHPSNYHSWSYRVWLVQQITDSGLDEETKMDILTKELEKGCKFIDAHLTDHSPVAYVCNVLKEIIKQTENKEEWVKYWRRTWDHCTTLQEEYEEYDSLWKYRRCLLLVAQPHTHLFTNLQDELNFCKRQGDSRAATEYYKFINKFVFSHE